MNRLIEFDGLQHTEFKNHWYKTEKEFLEVQSRD